MKVIYVMSGKGGVGKTTVAVNLAQSLNNTALMDADIHGPNVPDVLGITDEVKVQNNMMLPVEHKGIKVLSIGFMLGKNDSLAWRGPRKHSLIKQFIEQTDWGNPDYLVVDLPPGTGDEALSVIELLKQHQGGALIVSTPPKASVQDTKRCINFCNNAGLKITGIIENMSGGIFGEGTIKEVAENTDNNFLGKIPLDGNIPGTSKVSDFEQIAQKIGDDL